MLLCPTCGRELTEALICKCGTDLSLLRHVVARADYLFNQALAAYQAGRFERALECLAANAVLVPFDVEARLVQAKLLAQFKRWAEVEQLLDRLEATAPGHPDLAALREALTEAVGLEGDTDSCRPII
jgi:hypothetical protein